MAVFRYPNSRNWWYEFRFAGQRIRESTKTRSLKLAREAEHARRRQLEECYNGIRRARALPVSEAAIKWFELKNLPRAPQTLAERTRQPLRHILSYFAKKLFCHVEARDIASGISSDNLSRAEDSSVPSQVADTYWLNRYFLQIRKSFI